MINTPIIKINILFHLPYNFSSITERSCSATFSKKSFFIESININNVFFAISASGASKRLIRMAKIVKKQGGVTVAVTNQAKSPITEICDHVIITATREHIFYDQVSFIRCCQFFLLALFSSKFQLQLVKSLTSDLLAKANHSSLTRSTILCQFSHRHIDHIFLMQKRRLQITWQDIRKM